eukprot:TRINITY_DN30337_c0_g1_i1.p1 TRINITY_DN30337_c0_g1~~TRINITY_DN30337_c0_g1_i1.p1  ORF type:complete len:245 (+),score=18.75 TRINITY_DN30337_c0_g1_i1:297-1031(+)
MAHLRELVGSAVSSRLSTVGYHFEGSPDLTDFEDPSYYMLMPFIPERQCVILLSRAPGTPSIQEKIRWLDLQLSHMQCPYPLQHIEFTYTGDAIVQYVTEASMKKSLARGPFKWETQEIASRPCTEEDVKGLYWVGVSGTPPDLYPFVKQALQQFGEVHGEYQPHPSMDHHVGMLKYYFVPGSRKRLPPTIQFIRPDRPKSFPPTTVKVFTPDGALAPKCADFGKGHSINGCPDCWRRKLNAGG